MTERLSLVVLAASVLLLVCAGALFAGAITARELAMPQVVQVREPVYLPAVTIVTVNSVQIVTATPGPTPTPGPTATPEPTQTPVIFFVPLILPSDTPIPTATPRPMRRDPLGWIVCKGSG